MLEGVLREQQGRFRDPDRYFVSIFGTPGRFPWGWRLRGPSPVAERGAAGGRACHRDAVLHRRPSRHRARGAAQGLAPARGRRGSGAPAHGRRSPKSSGAPRSSPTARSARSSPARSASATSASRRGLELSAMDGPARNLVEALIDRFVGTLAPDLAAAQKQRVMEQELGRFRFAWAGTLAPGQAHYFRVHGPVTADRARQHAEQRQPHPLGVARPHRRFRQRRAGRPLPPPAAPLTGDPRLGMSHRRNWSPLEPRPI